MWKHHKSRWDIWWFTVFGCQAVWVWCDCSGWSEVRYVGSIRSWSLPGTLFKACLWAQACGRIVLDVKWFGLCYSFQLLRLHIELGIVNEQYLFSKWKHWLVWSFALPLSCLSIILYFLVLPKGTWIYFLILLPRWGISNYFITFIMAKMTCQCIFGLPLSCWWWELKMHNSSLFAWRELLVVSVGCSR